MYMARARTVVIGVLLVAFVLMTMFVFLKLWGSYSVVEKLVNQVTRHSESGGAPRPDLVVSTPPVLAGGKACVRSFGQKWCWYVRDGRLVVEHYRVGGTA